MTTYSTQLNWDPKWIKNYESVWSIFDKIKIANSISNSEICIIFIPNLRQQMSILKNNQSSIVFNDFDNTQTSLLLRFDLRQYQLKLRDKILNNFRTNNIEINSLFRKELSYCPICTKHNYHSILHQLVFVDYCPFHKVKLLTLKKNNIIFDNSLDTLLNNNFTFNNYIKSRSNWIKFHDSTEMKDTDLKIFIDVKLDQPKEIFFNQAFLSSSYKINKLNSLLGENNPQNSGYKLITLISPPIRTSDRTFDITSFDDIENLYKSTNLTYRSIARNIRKTFHYNHEDCIRRYIYQHPSKICKLAFSYVNWKRFVEGRNYSWEIDNGRRIKSKPLFFTTASTQDNEYILEAFLSVFNQIDKSLWKKSIVHWFINRLLSLLLTSHYKKWSEIANNNEQIHFKYYSCPFHYEHVPPYIFEITDDPRGFIKFHYWIK